MISAWQMAVIVIRLFLVFRSKFLLCTLLCDAGAENMQTTFSALPAGSHRALKIAGAQGGGRLALPLCFLFLSASSYQSFFHWHLLFLTVAAVESRSQVFQPLHSYLLCTLLGETAAPAKKQPLLRGQSFSSAGNPSSTFLNVNAFSLFSVFSP